jgi:hypothetical protein
LPIGIVHLPSCPTHSPSQISYFTNLKQREDKVMAGLDDVDESAKSWKPKTATRMRFEESSVAVAVEAVPRTLKEALSPFAVSPPVLNDYAPPAAMAIDAGHDTAAASIRGFDNRRIVWFAALPNNGEWEKVHAKLGGGQQRFTGESCYGTIGMQMSFARLKVSRSNGL